MKITKVETEKIGYRDNVRVKECGNIIEIAKIPLFPHHMNITRLDEDSYMINSTGEVKDIKHIATRKENYKEIKISLERLKDYINTNCTCPDRLRWITLTYRENMKDTKRLYKDAERFIKRFRYKYGKFEYIIACEPQQRGAWHIHMIAIFSDVAPFIPNKTLRDLWQQGFVKITDVNSIDNLGVYFSAYLGDMELTDEQSNDEFLLNAFKDDLKVIRDANGKISKKILKGNRLSLYPPNFNIYRCSRGIIKPNISIRRYDRIKKELDGLKPTYSQSIKLEDTNFNTTITKEYYNRLRKD